MAKQSVGIGSSANDGQGDTLRTGATKINDNFNEIYAEFGDGTNLSSGNTAGDILVCLLYTSPSPRDKRQSRMPSSA